MRKWFKRFLVAMPVLVAAIALAVWWLLRGSLPALDGEPALHGLSAPVRIERDALGVVSIDAANETDALRALGYVHAQERYFEMDLMRRTSAGELSELFGPIALDLDRKRRTHRMRARVDAHLDAVAGERLPQLQAYADGVNAGLAALRVRPWPYLLLRQEPRPWLTTDTALAGYAMYFDLQDSANTRELALWTLQPHLPPALFALLTHRGSRWDAPMRGEGFGDAVLPGAEAVDLRKLPVPPGDLAGSPAAHEHSSRVALTPPSALRTAPLSPAGRERGIGGSPAASSSASRVALTPPSAPRTVPLSPAGREGGVGESPAASSSASRVALTPPSALRTVPLSPARRERGVGGSPAASSSASRVALAPPSALRTVPLSPAGRERGVGWSPAATDLFPGSNNFAVSGALTADGRAIVADDMHLGLRVPNIWFRARLRYPDAHAPGGNVDVQGVTLPGLPLVVVGSNGHVAWGYTNSYGDYLDWALETPCGEEADGATPPCTRVDVQRERILVAGAEPVEFEVRETRWGPILHDLPDGKVLSLRWTAHLPGSVNLGLMGFAGVADLDAALALADRTAIPTQNLVIGDSQGNIAWRLLGPLPAQRLRTPRTIAPEGAAGIPPAGVPTPDRPGPGQVLHTDEISAPWSISTDASPRIESPDADRLWTANARVVSGEALQRIGDGGYDLGARAQQIRDDLRARDRFTEADLLAIQLDDRATLLTQWWQLLRSLPRDDASPALRELADAAADWPGRAHIDSASYRLVRAWRLAVHARLLDGLLAPARAAMGDDFIRPDLPQFEGVAWPLVQQRPLHLLPPRFASWQALFEDAAKDVRDELAPLGPLHERTWGERNTARICHPLAAAIPLLGERALCMPAEPLPGDGMMARVQAPSFGASERMVVSPGREADGLLHMPGGQSGHPLSPFWGAGHDDWVHGRPTPFLPGPAAHTLVLRP